MCAPWTHSGALAAAPGGSCWLGVRLGAGTRSVPAAGAGVAALKCVVCCLLLLSADVAVPFAFLLWFGLARVGILVQWHPICKLEVTFPACTSRLTFTCSFAG